MAEIDEIKIPIDVEGKKAVASLKEIRAYLNEIRGSFGDNAGELRSYKTELNDVTASLKKLQQAQKENKELSAEQTAELTRLTSLQIELKQSIAASTREINAQIKENVALDDSYNQLSSTLSSLCAKYKALSEAQRESLEGQQLVEYIQQLDTKLKDLNAEIGNFQRNVGNYKIATEGLVQTISGIKDGVEALSSFLDLFGISIDKNFTKFIQIVSTSITLVSKLAKGWNTVTTVIKGVIASMSTLAKAMVGVGVGLVISAVAVLAANWDKVKAALSKTTDEQLLYNETLTEAEKQTSRSAATIRAYTSYLEQDNLTIEQRRAALQSLAKAMGDTVDATKNLNDEEERLRNNADAYIKVQIKKAQAELLIAKNAELWIEMQEKKRQIEEAEKDYDNAPLSGVPIMQSSAGAFVSNDPRAAALGRRTTLQRELNELEEKEKSNILLITDALNQAVELSSAIVINTKEDNSAWNKRQKSLEEIACLRERALAIYYNPNEDKEMASIWEQLDNETALLEKALEKRAITQKEYDDRMQASAARANDALAALQNERREQQYNELEAENAKKLEIERQAFEARNKIAEEAENRRYEEVQRSNELQYNLETKFGEAAIFTRLNAQQTLFEAEYKAEQEHIENMIALRQQQLESELLTQDERARIESEIDAMSRQYADKQIEYAEEVNVRTKKLNKERAQAGLNIAQEMLNSTGNLLGSIADLYEEGSEEQKNILIAQTVVNGLAGVAGAISGAMLHSAELGPIAAGVIGAINAATVVATTVAQIQKIKSGTDDISGTGSAAATPAVVGNVLDTAALSTQLSNETEFDLQKERQDTRVYVVEEDITRTQNDVRVTVEERKF